MNFRSMFERIVRNAEGAGSTPPADPTPVADPAVGSVISAEPPAEPPKDPPAGDPPKDPPADPAKPPEPQKPPEPVKPEDYKIEGLPETIKADDPMVKAFLDGAADAGLTNEAVNKVLGKIAPLVAAELEAPAKTWLDMNAKWQAAVKADPEFGGVNFDANVQRVASAINLVSTPEQARAIDEALKITGAGNNPALVGLLHRMSVRLTEPAKPVGGTPTPVPKDPAEALYPSATKPAASGS
jgi:hypothetical protein